MLDKTPIIDLMIDHNPMAAVTMDFMLVNQWVAQGCDIDKDIVPTIRMILMQAKARGKTITGLAYFTRAINEAKEKRLMREQVESRITERFAPPDDDKIRAKMKRIAWMRQMGIGSYSQYRHELEAYEAKHGKVAVDIKVNG